MRRALLFLVLAVGLGAAAVAGGDWRLAALGMGALAVVIALGDAWHRRRFAAWLRRWEGAPPPPLGGTWRELAKRVERALRQQEAAAAQAQGRLQDFLAAIQASPNGVVLLDQQGRIEWCNLTAGQHFGIDSARDLLQPIGHLVRDPSFGRYWTEASAAARPGAVTASGEALLDGHRQTSGHPQRLSLQLHPYGEGKFLLLSRDVTAVEQAEAMRRDFVANVSHEIRTPLTVLSGFIETLRHVPVDDAQRQRYLGLMNEQAVRLSTLVGDLLTLSRLEGSPPPGFAEWTPVRALLAQCEAEARALAATAGATPLQLRIDEAGDDEVCGAARELQSAMSNLVSNAVRYTPSATGQVHVCWRRQADGSAEFAVEDNGPGIAPEHLPRLTERFYRVDRSRSRDTGGTGLGLAIVKHVVQRHDGNLAITSKLGQGSRFAFSLPPSRLRGSTVMAPAAVASPAIEETTAPH